MAALHDFAHDYDRRLTAAAVMAWVTSSGVASRRTASPPLVDRGAELRAEELVQIELDEPSIAQTLQHLQLERISDRHLRAIDHREEEGGLA